RAYIPGCECNVHLQRQVLDRRWLPHTGTHLQSGLPGLFCGKAECAELVQRYCAVLCEPTVSHRLFVRSHAQPYGGLATGYPRDHLGCYVWASEQTDPEPALLLIQPVHLNE